MNNSPMVSVIIPAYNSEHFVGETVKSVLAQSYTCFEVIVVDDCSSDNTTHVVKDIAKSDDRVSLIELRKNYGGPAGPRNIGVSAARGEWICFLDADDIWHPEKLSVQISALTETGARFCSTQWVYFKTQVSFHSDRINRNDTKFKRYTFRQQCSKNRISNSGVIVDRSLAKLFPFNEAIEYKAVEDMQCWLQILEAEGSCLIVDEALVGYRISQQQISRNKIEMAKKFFMVINRYKRSSGDGLGPLRFWYFAQYCFLSTKLVLSKRKI